MLRIVALRHARPSANLVLMKIVIQLSREEEANALPILLRQSPGMILRERIYVLGEDAVGLLRKTGIRFTELSREAVAPCLEESAGERV